LSALPHISRLTLKDRRNDVCPDDIEKWFEEDELLECPRCGEQKLLPAPLEPGPVEFCLRCGPLLPPSDHE
jgi:hypothetical protein